MRPRIKPRTLAAVQFWMLDEFISSFIPIPFVDEFLMPVVFMLDRRVWGYTQAIEIGKDVLNFPKLFYGSVTWMPQTMSTLVSCTFPGVTRQDASTGAIGQLLQSIILFMISPIGILTIIIVMIPVSYVNLYVACWFWGGFINFRLKKLYGYKLASHDFSMWNSGARIARPLIRFDKKIRTIFHMTRISPYWFWSTIVPLMFLGILLLPIIPKLILASHSSIAQTQRQPIPFIGCL